MGVNFDIPLGLIYGGFLVIGHEMFHGFDDSGRFYDKEGMRFNWWRPKESKIYEEKTQCLVRKPFFGNKNKHIFRCHSIRTSVSHMTEKSIL